MTATAAPIREPIKPNMLFISGRAGSLTLSANAPAIEADTTTSATSRAVIFRMLVGRTITRPEQLEQRWPGKWIVKFAIGPSFG